MSAEASQWREYLRTCSNTSRFGQADERGTLNYIGPAQVLAATRTVTLGRSVSLAHDLIREGIGEQPPAVSLEIAREGGPNGGSGDRLSVSVHGFAITHLDALGHSFYEGAAYNGRREADVMGAAALRSCSMMAMAGGVITRGVLLDVAAAHPLGAFQAGEGVSLGQVLEAERRAGVEVGEGDAVLVRAGIGSDPRWSTIAGAKGRPGILPEVIPWLHERRVALYGGDCMELISGDGVVADMPLHKVGIVAMGLALLDNADLDPLARTCDELGRYEFLFVAAPLRAPSTGCAVNPLAVF